MLGDGHGCAGAVSLDLSFFSGFDHRCSQLLPLVGMPRITLAALPSNAPFLHLTVSDPRTLHSLC